MPWHFSDDGLFARLRRFSSTSHRSKRYAILASIAVALPSLLFVGYRLLAMFRDGSLKVGITQLLPAGGVAGIPIREVGLLATAAACALVLLALTRLVTVGFGSPPLYLSIFLAFLFMLIAAAGPFGHDVYHHLSRLDEVVEAVQSGQFPLSMSNRMAAGKGLPVFVFYPSWIYLVPAIPAMLGFSLLTSLKLAAGLLVVAAALTMYAALRSFVPPRQAQIGTFLYVSSNYFIGDFCARFAFAECHALVFLPLALLYIHRWLTQRDVRTGIVLVGVLTLLFIAHPPTGLNALLGLSVFAVWYSFQHVRDLRVARHLLAGTAIIVVSFATLTAFYWVPAALERSYVYLNEGLPANYWQHFRSWDDYRTFLDFRTPGYALLVTLVFSLVSSLAAGLRSSGPSSIPWSLVAPPLVYMYLVSPASRPFWDHIWIFQASIFPWRMLLPLIVFGSVLVSVRFMAHNLPNELWASLLSVFLFFQGLSMAFAFLWDPIRSSDGDMMTRLAQHAATEGGWGVQEYLPRVPNDSAVVAEPSSIQGSIAIMSREKRGSIDSYAIEPTVLAGHYRIDLYWHVRYRAYVDGSRTRLLVDDRGRVIVPLKPGQSKIVLVYTAPAYVVWSARASITMLIALGGLYILAIMALPLHPLPG